MRKNEGPLGTGRPKRGPPTPRGNDGGRAGREEDCGLIKKKKIKKEARLTDRAAFPAVVLGPGRRGKKNPDAWLEGGKKPKTGKRIDGGRGEMVLQVPRTGVRKGYEQSKRAGVGVGFVVEEHKPEGGGVTKDAARGPGRPPGTC